MARRPVEPPVLLELDSSSVASRGWAQGKKCGLAHGLFLRWNPITLRTLR